MERQEGPVSAIAIVAAIVAIRVPPLKVDSVGIVKLGHLLIIVIRSRDLIGDSMTTVNIREQQKR